MIKEHQINNRFYSRMLSLIWEIEAGEIVVLSGGRGRPEPIHRRRKSIHSNIQRSLQIEWQTCPVSGFSFFKTL